MFQDEKDEAIEPQAEGSDAPEVEAETAEGEEEVSAETSETEVGEPEAEVTDEPASTDGSEVDSPKEEEAS